MDPDLEKVIRQALGVAKAAGNDDMSQTMLAVRAVLQAHPNMTVSAMTAVNQVRQQRFQASRLGKASNHPEN